MGIKQLGNIICTKMPPMWRGFTTTKVVIPRPRFNISRGGGKFSKSEKHESDRDLFFRGSERKSGGRPGFNREIRIDRGVKAGTEGLSRLQEHILCLILAVSWTVGSYPLTPNTIGEPLNDRYTTGVTHTMMLRLRSKPTAEYSRRRLVPTSHRWHMRIG